MVLVSVLFRLQFDWIRKMVTDLVYFIVVWLFRYGLIPFSFIIFNQSFVFFLFLVQGSIKNLRL